MTDRIFVDTNILVYAHDVSAGPKNTTAKKLMGELWESKTGCISVQVMQEFYVTVTQKVPNPLESRTAIGIIRELKYWNIHAPDIDDVIHAVDIQQRNQVSFWDAMILQSAIRLECKVIWSEDLNPGQEYNGLKLVNPFL